jgi:Uri superfamily endonuclease|tara:strand:- start:411 stop:749 length:339 start_codon:yes stop_codon:yes gene_type:complete
MRSYQLHIKTKKELEIKIGKLGVFRFPKGGYIYTGSAKKNIDKRINRHISNQKKLHWHIDYLLNKGAEVIRVKKSNAPECELNQRVKGKIIVKGFGSSDCKKGCGSHLKKLG